MRIRGMALGTVILLSAVAAVTAFALAALGTSQLNFAQRHANGQDALYLAEAAIAETVGRLKAQRNYGQNGETVEIRPDPQDQRRSGILSFATDRGVPPSVNGLPQGEVNDGGTAHLIAVGRAHGAERKIEVLITLPGFANAVAAAGKIFSASGFEVLATAATDSGNVACNSEIDLNGKVRIEGDVQGTKVDLGDDAQVRGRVISPGLAQDLPFIDLDTWDPGNIPELAPHVRPVPAEGTGLNLQGPFRSGDDLVVDGNCLLDRALLFVNGDLTVKGKLAGTGMVVVKGVTTIEDNVAVSGYDVKDSNVAVLSSDTVDLQSASGQDLFRGLVYTRGDFQARQVRTEGVFVQGPERPGDTAPGARSMTLEQSRFTFNQKMADTNVVVHRNPGGTADGIVFLGDRGARTWTLGELVRDPWLSNQALIDNFSEFKILEERAQAATATKPFKLVDFYPGEDGGMGCDVYAIDLKNWSQKEWPQGSYMASLKERSQPEYRRRDPDGYVPPSTKMVLAVEVRAPEVDDEAGERHDYNIDKRDGRLFVKEADGGYRYTIMGGFDKGVGLRCMPELPENRTARREARNLPMPPGMSPLRGRNVALDVRAIMEEYCGRRSVESEMRAITMRLVNDWVDDVRALNQKLNLTAVAAGVHYERRLDLNQFLQDKTPFRVLAWRERE